MKHITYISISGLLLLAVACKGPMPVTANPDDHTNAGGTAGSARMTEQLPPKSDNMRVPDSIRPPDDSLRLLQ
jgi:hypothetical protein